MKGKSQGKVSESQDGKGPSAYIDMLNHELVFLKDRLVHNTPGMLDDPINAVTISESNYSSILNSLELLQGFVDTLDSRIISFSDPIKEETVRPIGQALRVLPDSELDKIVEELLLVSELGGGMQGGRAARASRANAYRRVLLGGTTTPLVGG